MRHGAIIEKARSQHKDAFNWPTAQARDFADTPCPRRVQILDRLVTRTADRYHKAAFDVNRLSGKMVAVVTLKNAGWQETLREVSEAMDLVGSARDAYARKLRSARNARGWARRSCRR